MLKNLPTPPKRQLRLTKQAAKSLHKLIRAEPKAAQAIATHIEQLRDNPTPRNQYKKITGYDCYRIRVGNYRVIYEFDDAMLLVTIIAKRAHVYQKVGSAYR